ncbi:gliding motility-associated C-terminal domain-containing protein, partial [Fulvivirga kasyanovii]
NGDGINETFEIWGTSDIGRFNLRIFNRAGVKIYQTNSINDYWKGSLHGKEFPSGVYYWVIDIQCVKGNSIFDNSYKGWVTLSR